MGLHRRSIRLRILLLVLVPILSLIGLYAFAVSITASDAINLARSKTVKNTIGLPTGQLEAQVDAERLLAVVYLASPNPLTLAALHAQEAKTSKAVAVFSAAVHSSPTMGSASAAGKQAFAVLLADLAHLPVLHSQITSLAISRAQAANEYGNIIADADVVLNQLILQQTNVPLVTQGLAFIGMGKSEEMLLQEDTLLMGDMVAQSFHVADRQEFAELVGARRAIYAQTLPSLDPIYRGYYEKDVSPRALASLATLEDSVINDPHPHGLPPVSLAAWNQAVGGVSAGLSRAGDQAANELTLRAQPVANATYRRLILAGGLGLLAILLSIIISFWIGRGLVRQLAGLKQSALELANVRLPSLVQRLRAGQDVDVSVEAPQLETSSDEIGQVREAFNAVQRTAVEAAVDEARVRRGISDVFRNLARRSQSLLHRQLALLDAMERRATEPGELEDLFRIDHLTTRMRRHSEGLIILSGESPGRGWRNPVPLADVLRAAVAEVEDYTRIRVTTGTRAALVGSAVADVIHLLAELAENATIFSPPNTPVRIHGDVVGRGFAVDIEDRGLGIPEEKLAEINHNLAHPAPFDLSGSDQLGLFIAGQLARRHKIQISLRPSPYGGTTAIVLIPQALVVDEAGVSLEPGSAAERALRLTGRHAALHQGTGSEPALTRAGALSAPAAQPSGPPAAPPPGPAAGAAPALGSGLSSALDADPPSGPAVASAPALDTGLSSALDADPPSGPAVASAPALGSGLSSALDADPPSGPAVASAPALDTGPDADLWPGPGPASAASNGSSSPAPAPAADRSPEPAFDPWVIPAGRAAAEAAAAGSADDELAEVTDLEPGTIPGSSLFGADQLLGGNGSAAAVDPRAATTDLGLPVRVRQASLAPQLKGRSGTGAAQPAASGPSPEAARSTFSALQRGWERGRSASGTTDPAPGAALSPEPRSEADPERSEE